MASKASSRWAAEDAEVEAKIQREKEEKKRKKQQKQAEKERLRRQQEAAAEQGDDQEDRPSKRRKLTPDAEANHNGASKEDTQPPAKLLRFESAGTWGRCRSVENYDKLNDIEEGTYGWVTRATDRATGTVVALKRLKLEAGDRGGLPVTGLREIQLLQDCRHRNVVEMKEVVIGDDLSKLDNSIYLVLEFMEHDLKSILDAMPEPFLGSEIKCLLLQLTAGIAHLHTNHVLHRDLKTSNLLLNNRGRLKIADFGMARYVSDPLPAGSRLTQLVVTLWYRSPELLLGASDYGRAVDMWSVGCIFAEIITREPLLQGKNEVDQISKIFELCGVPTDDAWPGFRRLPNAPSLRLPRSAPASPSTSALIRAKFPGLTGAGAGLLADLLSLDPKGRPGAAEVLAHEYFRQDPKPKPESMFPTFPSKAGQERRRRNHEPHAPARGQEAAALGAVDLSGIFQGRDQEERGGGFSLRMV